MLFQLITKNTNSQNIQSSHYQRQKQRKRPKKSTIKLITEKNHIPEDVLQMKPCYVCVRKGNQRKKKIKKTGYKLRCKQCNIYLHNNCWKEHKIMYKEDNYEK